MSDKDIERTQTDETPQVVAGGVAAIYTEFVETLIDEAHVISKVADKAVVFEVEVAVHAGHVTPRILIKEGTAWAEIVDQTVTHRRQVVTKRIELRSPRLNSTIIVVGDAKGRRGKTVVLLGFGIQEIAIELKSVSEHLVTARDVVHRLFHGWNRGRKGAEIEPRWVGARTAWIEVPIAARTEILIGREIDKHDLPRRGIAGEKLRIFNRRTGYERSAARISRAVAVEAAPTQAAALFDR